MKLQRVLFLAGGHTYDSAVKVRGYDVATRLGCAIKSGVEKASEIPKDYSIFVCVKPALDSAELHKLAQRGKVIWDTVDVLPPKTDVAVYLTSTTLARDLFGHYGRVEMIPHHHCNFEGTPNPLSERCPVWFGNRYWLPRLRGFGHKTFFADFMSREEAVAVYRQTGIGLNLRGIRGILHNVQHRRDSGGSCMTRRRYQKVFDVHLALTSGIKLLNCMGFGIPSISSDEPAYHEFGEDCTIFSNIRNCAKWVRALQHDDGLYMDLRRRCLRKAKKFHIDTIAERYKALFASF